MIPAAVVFVYLGIVLYIGIFASRRFDQGSAEGYFLAGRSLGPAVFLLSLFGTNMTAFTILGSAGHAFSNGIVTYGLMASSSALVIPITLFLIGTRMWALGKRHGFITPVQMFRDRWECGHIGTLIFGRERWHCAVLVRWRCGCACCDELCVFRWDARNSVGQQFSNRSLPRIRCGRVGVDWFKLGWLFPDDDPSTRI